MGKGEVEMKLLNEYVLYESGCGKWVHLVAGKPEFRSNKRNATLFCIPIDEVIEKYNLKYLSHSLEKQEQDDE